MTAQAPVSKSFKKNVRNDFLSGAGRAMDLFGRKSRLLTYTNGLDTITALARDWEAVGNDLRGATKSYLGASKVTAEPGSVRVRFIREDHAFRLEVVPSKMYSARHGRPARKT